MLLIEVITLLKEHEQSLHDLANLLLENETVNADELEKLLSPTKPQDPNPEDTNSGPENDNSSWGGFNQGTTIALKSIK